MKISKMEEAITYNYCTQITYASIWVSLSVFSHESNHTVLALRYRFARLEVSVYSMQAFFYKPAGRLFEASRQAGRLPAGLAGFLSLPGGFLSLPAGLLSLPGLGGLFWRIRTASFSVFHVYRPTGRPRRTSPPSAALGSQRNNTAILFATAMFVISTAIFGDSNSRSTTKNGV